jgi:hypothetical protein
MARNIKQWRRRLYIKKSGMGLLSAKILIGFEDGGLDNQERGFHE